MNCLEQYRKLMRFIVTGLGLVFLTMTYVVPPANAKPATSNRVLKRPRRLRRPIYSLFFY